MNTLASPTFTDPISHPNEVISVASDDWVTQSLSLRGCDVCLGVDSDETIGIVSDQGYCLRAKQPGTYVEHLAIPASVRL